MKIKHLFVAVLSAGCLLGSLTSCGDGGNGGDNTQQSQKFKINWQNGSSYEFERLAKEAEAGETVSFRIKLTGSEVVGEVSYTTASGKKEVIAPSSGSNPIYRFTMPAEDVTINVALATIQSIEVDATGAKKAFLLNSEFDSKGLVVKAVMTGASEAKEVTGFSVEAPDMTTAGAKTVTVTYGGQTATYTIKIGSFEATTVALKQSSDKVLLEIGGSYAGFASAEELTQAAKGDAGLDIQSNDNYGGQGWNRFYDSDEITYQEGATAGTFIVSIELNDLPAGGGNGYGYSIHFGLVITDEGNSEAGNPVNLDISSFDANPLAVGSKTYQLWYNSTWGVTSLMIASSEEPFVTQSTQDLQLINDIPTVVLEGSYGNLSDEFDDWFFMDIMQFDTWQRAAVKAPSLVKTPNAADANIGTYRLEFPLVGEDESHNPIAVLNDSKDYFFHFGHHTTGDGANMTALDGLETKTVTDSRGDEYSLFRNPSTDWKGGLLSVSYTYSPTSSVEYTGQSLTKVGDDAVFTLSGTTNITSTADSRFNVNCQVLDQWSYPEITPVVTINNGTFTIAINLNVFELSGYSYFFHYGASLDNLMLFEGTQLTSVTTSKGTYTLRTAEGKEGDSVWQNGMVFIDYEAAA